MTQRMKINSMTLAQIFVPSPWRQIVGTCLLLALFSGYIWISLNRDFPDLKGVWVQAPTIVFIALITLFHLGIRWTGEVATNKDFLEFRVGRWRRQMPWQKLSLISEIAAPMTIFRFHGDGSALDFDMAWVDKPEEFARSIRQYQREFSDRFPVRLNNQGHYNILAMLRIITFQVALLSSINTPQVLALILPLLAYEFFQWGNDPYRPQIDRGWVIDRVEFRLKKGHARVLEFMTVIGDSKSIKIDSMDIHYALMKSVILRTVPTEKVHYVQGSYQQSAVWWKSQWLVGSGVLFLASFLQFALKQNWNFVILLCALGMAATGLWINHAERRFVESLEWPPASEPPSIPLQICWGHLEDALNPETAWVNTLPKNQNP